MVSLQDLLALLHAFNVDLISFVVTSRVGLHRCGEGRRLPNRRPAEVFLNLFSLDRRNVLNGIFFAHGFIVRSKRKRICHKIIKHNFISQLASWEDLSPCERWCRYRPSRASRSWSPNGGPGCASGSAVTLRLSPNPTSLPMKVGSLQCLAGHLRSRVARGDDLNRQESPSPSAVPSSTSKVHLTSRYFR